MYWGSIQMHAKANDIIYVANSLVGVPYRHQGRNQNGVDCAGLIVVVGQMLDLMTAEEKRDYPRRPNVKAFTEEMIKVGLKQRPHNSREHGDILRVSTATWPVHLGIYEVDARGLEWIIHAYQPHKKVTRDPLSIITKHCPISSIWRYSE